MTQCCLEQVVISCMLCHMLYSKSAANSEPNLAVTDKSGCTYSIEDKIREVGEFLNLKLHNLASTLIEMIKENRLIIQHWT